MSSSLAVAFLPWLVFAVSARGGGLGFLGASVAGLLSALGVALYSRQRTGGVRGFEVATVASFVVLGALSLTAGARVPHLSTYDRAMVATCLTLLAFASLLRRPLTEPYTRDAVRASELTAPAFAKVNRGITAAWGVGAAAMAGSFAVGAALHGPVVNTVCNWLVPLALVLGCVRCAATQWRHAVSDDEPEEQALLASVGGLPYASDAGTSAATDAGTTTGTSAGTTTGTTAGATRGQRLRSMSKGTSR